MNYNIGAREDALTDTRTDGEVDDEVPEALAEALAEAMKKECKYEESRIQRLEENLQVFCYVSYRFCFNSDEFLDLGQRRAQRAAFEKACSRNSGHH